MYASLLFKLFDQAGERNIFTQRELRLALALMKASNAPSAPVQEPENIPSNPIVPHPDQTD